MMTLLALLWAIALLARCISGAPTTPFLALSSPITVAALVTTTKMKPSTDENGWLVCQRGGAVQDKQPVTVHYRGRSSRLFPKHQWSVHTKDHDWASATEVSLLGQPPGSSWALNGPFLDTSLVRNAVTFRLARETGHWAPRTSFLELYVGSGDLTTALLGAAAYEGVYVLMEKIERGKDRVNVGAQGTIFEISAAESDAAWAKYLAGQGLLDSRDEDDGPAVSVGPSNFIVKYPGKKDVSSASLADLHGWLLDLDRSIRSLCPGTGFSGSSSTPNAGASATPDVTAFSGPAACRGLDSLHHVLDVDTMIDYVLVEELVSNPDAYMTSVYAHRERGGPLVMGAVWDFNICCGMDLGTPGSPGVAKLRFLDPTCVGRSTIAQWLQLLWKVPDFRARTRDRWIALRRGAWSNAALEAAVRAEVKPLSGGPVDRNAARWNPATSTSQSVGLQIPLRPYLGSWEAEIDALVDFFHRRAAWLDDHLQ